MELEKIMNLFSDMLIIIEDEKGNIVYPNDIQLINYTKDLKSINPSKKDELYHPDTNRCFKVLKTSYQENNHTFYLTRYIEITEYKKREKELQTDETTGLIIKKEAYKEFNEYLKSTIEKGEEFSTIITDADFFKKVNDKYGHLAGDYVLRYIADTLLLGTRHNEGRPKDIVGRIGGEEFLIVLKNIPDEVSLTRLNSLRTKIANAPILYEGNIINITCSFGLIHVPSSQIKLVPQNENSINRFRSIIQQEADMQLYAAKEAGRNNVQMKKFTM